ncbi:hypothetical protein AB0O95_00985 [Rhodoglobus sp. NPDC076762]
MIWLAIMALSGASLGIYQALATVPRLRVLPFVGGAVLIMGLIVWPNIPPNDVVTPAWLNLTGVAAFLIATVVASTLYSAKLWLDCYPEAGLTYWEFVRRDFIGAPYVRQQYAAMLADREELRATWDHNGRGGGLGTTSEDSNSNGPAAPPEHR